MKKLSFEEYTLLHKKMTKTQIAYYEKNFGYRTRLGAEKLQKELQEIKEFTQKRLQEFMKLSSYEKSMYGQ